MPGPRLNIRPQAPGDADGVWGVLEPVVRSGESFVDEPDATREEVLAAWLVPNGWNFVAELDGRIAAAFYVKANGTGLSGHIANASFAVNPAARGHGVGRAIGEFALGEALPRLRGDAVQRRRLDLTRAPSRSGARSVSRRSGGSPARSGYEEATTSTRS